MDLAVIASLLLLAQLLSPAGGRVRIKKVRAPSVSELGAESRQDLDDRNIAKPESSTPPGFLSPSVKEYLQLGKSIPGRPGTDYPVLHSVPYTNFYCDEQPYPGFFADVETRCQGWHYCDLDGRQATFLCPNGTQFSQAVFVCDWWFNVRCELSPALYPINKRLYGTPTAEDPARSHRAITRELLENIFV
ncbi:uncharacterized protein LOC134542955 [Bacillus rossius redtenbacheri]|uniref:uncharacterized protein LOC134542955 n=1 Tax=Bacillus rossius redtenbacheri TaxID=93214 RepID=UPI002FDCA492